VFYCTVRHRRTGKTGKFSDFLDKGTELYRLNKSGSPFWKKRAKGDLNPPRILLREEGITSGEYAFVSGRRWYNKKMTKEKDKEKIYDKEKTLQTLKTNDVESKIEALKSFAAVKDQLFTFYQARWITKQRFHLHRRISSSKAQIANIFVKRVRQLEKLGSVVVAWGQGSQNPSFGKGNPSTPNKTLPRLIKKQLGGQFRFTDEFRTSQKCYNCHSQLQKQIQTLKVLFIFLSSSSIFFLIS